MDFENETLVSIKLFTKYERYQIGTNTISLPIRFSRYELSKLVNEALGLDTPTPFDFIIDGKLLRVSLSEYMSKSGLSSESTITLEYVPIIGRPEEKSSEDLPDWVSGIASNRVVYVAGCYDGTVHVYNQNDEIIVEQSLHKKPIKAVDCCIINGSSYIATASLDNTVRVSRINKASLTAINTCSGHDSHVMSCKFSHNAQHLVSSAWNGSILIWDVSSMELTKDIEPIHSLSESLLGVTALDWWDNNIVSGGWDHHIRVWDMDSEGIMTDMKGNKVINSLTVNETTQLIASASPDGVRLWDSRQDKANVLSFVSNHNWVSAVNWHSIDSNILTSSNYGGEVCIFDIRSSFPVHMTPKVHDGKIFAQCWKDEGVLLTGGEDKKMKRISVANQ